MLDAAQALQLSVAKTAVTLRQVYEDAPGQATFVWRMGYAARDAADEIDALFHELLPSVPSNNTMQMRRRRERRLMNVVVNAETP